MTGLISIHHLDLTTEYFEKVWSGNKSSASECGVERCRAGDLVTVHEVVNGKRTNRMLLLKVQCVIGEKGRRHFTYCWDSVLQMVVTGNGVARKLVKGDV